jgi:hypothetical protein
MEAIELEECLQEIALANGFLKYYLRPDLPTWLQADQNMTD